MNSRNIFVLFLFMDSVLTGGIRSSKITELSRKLEKIYSNNQNKPSIKRDSKSLSPCPFTVPINCQSDAKYANFDGSCNNLINPYYGKSATPFKRLEPAMYDDGFNSPKLTNLPNPRIISTRISEDTTDATEVIWTHLFMSFGQFLTHDLVETAESSVVSRNDCIQMPDNDVMGISCMSFTRSSATLPLKCNKDGSDKTQREQLNLLTAFIDGSQVYGVSKEVNEKLRSFFGGEMLVSKGLHTGRDYLKKTEETCSARGSGKCFDSGDSRTTENLGLSGMHTLFIREHNRIAKELKKINVNWNDEVLFQETRRIIRAIIQHITYSQYVPDTIGLQIASAYNLLPNPNANYSHGYNSSVNAQLSNEFATAAFRFGHSLVANQHARYNKNNKEIDRKLSFTDINFRVDEAYNTEQGGLDSIVIGLLNSQCAKRDVKIASDLQNKLINYPNGPLLDLAAINIHRGRDHGLPGYTIYVKRCSGIKITTFSDLSKLLWTDELINTIQQVYKKVEDIDLWLGLLAEGNDYANQSSNIILGSTHGCLLAEQFRDLKFGDRFYYENAPLESQSTANIAFTIGQLNEIKKVSLSTLICNSFDILEIQPDAFFTAETRSESGQLINRKIKCSAYDQMNLKLWKNEKNGL